MFFIIHKSNWTALFDIDRAFHCKRHVMYREMINMYRQRERVPCLEDEEREER